MYFSQFIVLPCNEKYFFVTRRNPRFDNAKSFDAETFVFECYTYSEFPFAFLVCCDLNLCCKTCFLVQRTVILFDDSRGISGPTLRELQKQAFIRSFIAKAN